MLLFLGLCSSQLASAQALDLGFNALGFFDNREYKGYANRSRTYSGTRFAFDLGLHLDSNNRFVAGLNGLHEFGARPFFGKIDPVMYYQYTGQRWQFNAGAFPREGLVSDFPRALLNDTLRYFRPNVEGLLARYQHGRFTTTVFIDWMSRQTATDREQFLFGSSGGLAPGDDGVIFGKYFVYMFHDAGAAVLRPDDRLSDNGAAQFRIGLDLSRKQHFLDSLSLEAGGMFSFERTRGLGGWRTPKGFVASAYLAYRRFALFDEFYQGEGHNLIHGDRYFSQRFYNRLDVIFTPFLFRGIKGQFIFSFHQSPQGAGSNQQAFRITYDLGRRTLLRLRPDL
ncbi:hypothetical protein GCM10023313_11980 [Mucilaginibacter defluvii]|uniref:Porin n=1 Tax=Mucilaginibacter defluvii TaxID=1196019 RepID=A0ABP9FND2_9SPHI